MLRGTVYAPRPGTPLLAAFCQHYLKNHPDPLTRADTTLWVPSKRIGETFKEALTQAAGGATTLPRIFTISYDEDLDAALSWNTLEGDTPLPTSVITSLERNLFLTQRIRALDKTWSLEQATTAATSLGQLFDTFFDHNLTLADLTAQLPDAFAAHWQKNLVFLKMVFEEYPHWLADQGKLDPRQHLHRVLQQQTAAYQAGHKGAVYALGFADTTTLGLTLLRAMLSLPQAELWLPPTPLEALQDPLPPTHPFATTRALLDALAVTPNKVKILGDIALHNKLIDRAFTPAPLTHRWQKTAAQGTAENLTLVEAPTPAREAEVIALLLRQVADSPNKTIALVTPNRSLATQVAAQLTQWGIRANDSAGTPFLTTSLGRVLGLLLTLRQDGAHPQTLSALLAHPLVNCPTPLAQTADRDLLRGLWLGDLWQGYHSKLAKHPNPEPLQNLLHKLEEATQPLFNLTRGTLADWLQAAIAALNLLGDLPTGEEADQLAQFRTQLFAASDGLGALDAYEGIDYLLALLRQHPARLSQYQHPRIFIWGTQEARLQKVDQVILASLNTGHWPRGLGSHPWLNPQIMAALGLPAPETRLGLNAHDFYSLLQTPEVTLTRSLREVDGTETTPSPYLSRLLLAFGPDHPAVSAMKERGKYWLNLAHSVNLTLPDVPGSITPPALTTPGEKLQSQRWSMSHVKNLLQCPYKAYASRLLALKELEPYAADPDAADMGNILHAALEAFFQPKDGWPAPFGQAISPANLPAALSHWEAITQRALAEMRLASLQALWAPRLRKIGQAIFNQLAKDSATRQVEAVEQQHILPGQPDITARFDRLDTTPQGKVVVDYKTGGIPSWNDLRQGWEPQLLLEGALLAAQGQKVSDLEFWQLKVKAGGLKVHSYADKFDDLPEQLTLAQKKLNDIKAQFASPNAQYPAVPAGPSTLKLEAPCKTCPYQGVCRLHEWYGEA